jgi:hypothetical protein
LLFISILPILLIFGWAGAALSAGENAGSRRNNYPRGRHRPSSSMLGCRADHLSSTCSTLTTRKIKAKHAKKLMAGALHQNHTMVLTLMFDPTA